jgi:hypothetical protein
MKTYDRSVRYATPHDLDIAVVLEQTALQVFGIRSRRSHPSLRIARPQRGGSVPGPTHISQCTPLAFAADRSGSSLAIAVEGCSSLPPGSLWCCCCAYAGRRGTAPSSACVCSRPRRNSSLSSTSSSRSPIARRLNRYELDQIFQVVGCLLRAGRMRYGSACVARPG